MPRTTAHICPALPVDVLVFVSTHKQFSKIHPKMFPVAEHDPGTKVSEEVRLLGAHLQITDDVHVGETGEGLFCSREPAAENAG